MLKKVDAIRQTILKASSIEETLSTCLVKKRAVLAIKSSANVRKINNIILIFFESGRNLNHFRFCSSFLYPIWDFVNVLTDIS